MYLKFNPLFGVFLIHCYINVCVWRWSQWKFNFIFVFILSVGAVSLQRFSCYIFFGWGFLNRLLFHLICTETAHVSKKQKKQRNKRNFVHHHIFHGVRLAAIFALSLCVSVACNLLCSIVVTNIPHNQDQEHSLTSTTRKLFWNLHAFYLNCLSLHVLCCALTWRWLALLDYNSLQYHTIVYRCELRTKRMFQQGEFFRRDARKVEEKVLNSPITTFIKSFLKVNIEPEWQYIYR